MQPVFASGRSRVGRVERQNLCNLKGNYLPITRYESLYFKNTNITLEQRQQQFCGKFYFYESDSDMFLFFGNCLVSSNKVDAMIKLLIKNSNSSATGPSTQEIINNLINSDNVNIINCLLDIVNLVYDSNYYYNNGIHNFPFDVIDNDIDNQLILVLNFLTTLLYNDLDIAINSLNFNNVILDSLYNKYVNGNKQYVGDRLVELWDHLDQPICNLAKKLGYDTVIFQREAGSNRVNSEILDTRLNSYNYLCKNVNKNNQNNTIWFSNLGFYNK